MTTVISVRRRKSEDLVKIEGFLYVGRSVPRAGWDQTSRWCNPWRVSDFIDPESCMVHYTSMVARVLGGNHEHTPDTLTRSKYEWERFVHGLQTVHLLKDRVLGCWCGLWRPGQPEIPCHAVVLAKLADGEIDG